MSTTRIQLRGDTAANWTSANPVLADREVGLETDTNQYKVGDGALAWNSLSYYVTTPVLSGGTNINITDLYDINLDAAIEVTSVEATSLSGVTIYENGATLSSTYAPKTIPYEFAVAASDETTAITTGTAKITFLSPAGFTVTGATASLSTAGTTLSTFDVNKGGVTIFSTLLTIDANEKNSTTAATPAVITGGTWAQYDEITVDIDGAGTNAAGLKILFTGSRTL